MPRRRSRRAGQQEREWRTGWEAGVLDLAPLGVDGGDPGPESDITTEIALDPGAGTVTGSDSRVDVGRLGSISRPKSIRTSFARAWSAPASDPADAREMVVRFRRAAVSLALSLDEGSPVGEHAREGAAALVSLASTDQEALLADILRADPRRADVTWTVACYQIGDLSPTTLRDFADASSAVRILAGCGEAAHVAAELIVTNGDGVRWTALVRSGSDVTFQLLEPATASAPSGAMLQRVRHRWEDRLMDWAARPTEGLEMSGDVAFASDAGTVVSPLAAAPASGEVVAVGVTLGQLLESVRRIEDRLGSGPGGDGPGGGYGSGISDPTRNRVERLEREVWDLRQELAASGRRVAALEAALQRSVDHPGTVTHGGILVAGASAAPALARSASPDRPPRSR